MQAEALIALINRGETSTVQFKENIRNVKSVAQEMVAFSNSKGGTILIGVNDKTWEITGLKPDDIRRLTDMVVNVANEHIKSPIFIETQTIPIEDKMVMIVTIPEGVNKPYKDKEGLIFLKNGANKRKVTSNEELARLLQSSGNLYAEQKLIRNSTYEDVNIDVFENFYTQKYKQEFDREKLGNYIENLDLGRDGKINIACALFFTKRFERNIPGVFIAAVWFKGNERSGNEYWNSKNLTGRLDQQYEAAYAFIINALLKKQVHKSFNSNGEYEIPEIVIQELLVNALVHRDYFINDTIKIFIYQNRIEIISPGVLPNNLTTEKIKRGIRKKRNPIIDSFAYDLLEYRGVGSGIIRALQAYPDIEFFNDIEGEEFVVTIKRPE